jgi:hypothetical protein
MPSIKDTVEDLGSDAEIVAEARTALLDLAKQRGWKIVCHDFDRTEICTEDWVTIEVKQGELAMATISAEMPVEFMDGIRPEDWQDTLDCLASLIAKPKRAGKRRSAEGVQQ